MRYRDSKIQNYIIVIHAPCLKIIFISVKYKQMNVIMYTYTTGHMRYCVYKDSLIQKLNNSKTCNIKFEKRSFISKIWQENKLINVVICTYNTEDIWDTLYTKTQIDRTELFFWITHILQNTWYTVHTKIQVKYKQLNTQTIFGK